MVESQPSKLLVAGSIPVSRSRFCCNRLFSFTGWMVVQVWAWQEFQFEFDGNGRAV